MTNKENPFNLRLLVDSSKKVDPILSTKNYTQDEIQKMLKDYALVNPVNIENIPIGTHIRYKSNGEFKKGGFIVLIYKSAKSETVGNIMIKLKSTLQESAKEWTINVSKCDEIWKTTKFDGKKNQEEESTINDPALKHITQVEYKDLLNKLDKLSMDYTNLHNEQRRMLLLIRKLHKI